MPNKTNLSIGAVIALLIAAYLGLDLQQSQPLIPSASDTTTETLDSEPNLVPSQKTDDLDRIARAFQHRQSDLQVRSSGQVVAVYQMIMKDRVIKSSSSSYQMAKLYWLHIISIWHRVFRIFKNRIRSSFMENMNTVTTGVIHWTHHDPARKHVAGWLKHQGRTYQ